MTRKNITYKAEHKQNIFITIIRAISSSHYRLYVYKHMSICMIYYDAYVQHIHIYMHINYIYIHMYIHIYLDRI
jgi:hypothetical protein